jgi:hypothetical protein
MKPLGQKPHKQNFEDFHMIGHRNWWEGEGCEENKAANRVAALKEIQRDLEERAYE